MRGEPYSYRGLCDAMAARDMGYNFRTIQHHLRKLSQDRLSGIRSKEIGRAFIVWYGWDLPVVEGRERLDEMARNGQCPVHQITAMIRDVVGPQDDGFFRPEREPTVRSQSLEKMRSLISKAKGEILWWSGDMSPFDELKDLFRAALRKGVQIKLLMNINPYSIINAKKVIELQKEYSGKLELRHWSSEWRGAIFDRNDVRLIDKYARLAGGVVNNGKPGSDKDFVYKAWNIPASKYNLAQWVNWFCMVWETHWEKAGIGPKPSILVEDLFDIANSSA